MSLLQNPEVYRSILERLHTGVYVVDRERRIVFWNQGAEHISGYLSQDVVGRCCAEEILAHCDSNNLALCGDNCPLLHAMRDGRTCEASIFLRHKLGYRIPVHIFAMPLKDAQGNVIGSAESFEEPRNYALVERRDPQVMDGIDVLTGLPGAAASRSAIVSSITRLAECGAAFSAFRIHVDHLGQFMADHGPEAGAHLLRAIAQTLRNALRPGDYLGCWSNREFIGLLPVHRKRALLRVAERLRGLGACAAVTWWGDRFSLTLSFGMATVAPGDSLESLVARADRALDRSIEQGGNRFTFCPLEEETAGAESCS